MSACRLSLLLLLALGCDHNPFSNRTFSNRTFSNSPASSIPENNGQASHGPSVHDGSRISTDQGYVAILPGEGGVKRSPLQLGRDAYMSCIPDHPAWRLLQRKMGEGRKGPQVKAFRQILAKAETRLYRSRDGGAWQEMLRYRAQSALGEIRELIPLGDGSFLALARGFFSSGQARSPLARFQRGPSGALLPEGLLALDASGLPPAMAKYESDEPRQWEYRRDCKALFWLTRILWTPKGLVLMGNGGVLLLDPQNGAIRQRTFLPEGGVVRDCQPMQDGRLRVSFQKMDIAHGLVNTLPSGMMPIAVNKRLGFPVSAKKDWQGSMDRLVCERLLDFREPEKREPERLLLDPAEGRMVRDESGT